MNARGEFKDGRVAQKRRTRQALLDAGLRVLERGEEPTLDSVAAEADVSRATAYRYFPRIEALLAVLPLANLVADPDAIVDGSSSPAEGASQAQKYFYDLAVDNELAFRTFLRAILDEQLREGVEGEYEPLRGGYRLRTLESVLAPLEGSMDPEELRHLKVALVVLSGIEALMAVKDVLGLDAQAGWESLEWAGRRLLGLAVESVRNGIT